LNCSWYICVLLVLILGIIVPISTIAQTDDESSETRGFGEYVNDIFHQAINSVKRDTSSHVSPEKILQIKSETPYMKYEGRIIRRIIVKQYGFEKKFIDTSGRVSFIGTKILNGLHVNTQERVIRNNLFFKEGRELNPYIIADNERFLRSLDFIQDARIIVKPVRKRKDSVDIEIITKDLFSITGIVDIGGVNRLKGRAADVNFLGMGQTMQVTSLIDKNRKPLAGYEILYSKQNLSNSFVSATLAYTDINSGYNGQEEKAYYIKLDRPLISPYSHAAGGVLISKNIATNNYGLSDTAYYNYRYNVYDYWVGYNLSIYKLMKKIKTNRSRQFLSIRYQNVDYNYVPFQVGTKYDPIYNNRQTILGGLTLFKENYFKTQYIYGFGTTEDYPIGYKISFTGGWRRQLTLERPYAGIDANQYVVSNKGDLIQYFYRAGSFYNKGRLEDESILLGVNVFGRLMFLNNENKIRQNVKLTYTRLWNQRTYPLLRIDNPFGVNDFRSDSVLGDRRISLYTETILFNNNKILGFRIAPFVFGSLSYITPHEQAFGKSDLFSGVGGGFRTRNENLVFGTIEFKATYFPRNYGHQEQFKIIINTDIRYKYKSTYVNAPDVISLNTDNN
jgi:hypothetical protein